MSVVINGITVTAVPLLRRDNHARLLWGGDILKRMKYAALWISRTRTLKVSILGGFAG